MKLLINILATTLLFSTIAQAKMKYFVVGHNGKNHIIGFNNTRPAKDIKVLGEAPLDDKGELITHIEDVKKVQVEDEYTGELVDKWVFDVDGRTQRLLAEQAIKQAESDKEGRKFTRVQAAKAAFTNWDTLTANQKDQVLKALLKDWLIREREEQE